MPINTGSFSKALWPGINAWYGKEYNEFKVEWTELFDQFTSRKAFEEDVGISSYGLAQIKPEGQSVQYDTEIQAFIKACVEGRDYLMDIAQQTHLHCTPSSAPSVFRNMGEEMAEIEAIESFTAKRFPL